MTPAVLVVAYSRFLHQASSPQARARALAAEAAYRAWAHARRLDASPGAHRFRGEMFGRRLRFFTGLSGTRPIQVELTVEGQPPVAEAILLERDTRSGSLVATALHRLFRIPSVENIGITSARVRLRFSPLAPLDALDRTLEVLCSMLDRLEGHATRTA